MDARISILNNLTCVNVLFTRNNNVLVVLIVVVSILIVHVVKLVSVQDAANVLIIKSKNRTLHLLKEMKLNQKRRRKEVKQMPILMKMKYNSC